MEERVVLCASSCYTKKYYLNPDFENLPPMIKDELKIMCVLYTEEVSGTIEFVFDEDGSLQVLADHEETDLFYDEIGSYLKIKQMQLDKRELFEALETYYKVVFLGEGFDSLGGVMLLTIDVGNTNITLGVFDGDDIVGTFRVTTKISRTSDELGIVFKEIMHSNNIDANKISDVIIASVVPNVMHSLTSAIIKYFDITPIVVEAGIKTGIRIATENPKQIGADRIVDAAGAYELYGGPLIVIDYGTATTYDLVDANGAFLAGVTAPGIRICAKALTEDAAKLPEVEIRKPEHVLAKETITSMQSGIVYGQIGQTEYIVKHMIEESGFENVKVIATGGLGNIIANETDCIEIYNPNLTLYGMKFIYDKQKR